MSDKIILRTPMDWAGSKTPDDSATISSSLYALDEHIKSLQHRRAHSNLWNLGQEEWGEWITIFRPTP